ncbi:conserved hypothetical protein [Burkholderiales bacterium 8X]|nr:conserved hypothetical protein [Burkholderiales bacterium 8X]
MKNPIKLTIDEPVPGSFIWTLLETDPDGAPRKVLRSAEDGYESYEAALASGTRMMDAELRRETTH